MHHMCTCTKPAHGNQINQSSELQSPSAMADDDDDDFFGDFKFAPTPTSYAAATASTAAINTSSTANGGDSFSDDDWGDFVATGSDQIKTGFELSNGKNVQSDLSNSVSNESAATRDESAVPNWVKPRGALPLSLFGEAEDDEEESGVGEPAVGDGTPIFFRKKDDNDAKKKGLGLNGGVGINDLLANLYADQQIKVQNGLDVNSNVNGANSNSNESVASVDGLTSSLNELNWHKSGFDSFFHDANQIANNLESNITDVTSNSNGLSSDLVKQSNFDDDDDDDDGWEFKGAYAEKQEQGVVEFPGTKVEPVEDQKIQVDDRGRLNIEEPGPTIGFSNGATANGSIDISIRSDDTTHRAGDWNSAFDFNQSSMTQDDLLWDSNAKNQKNDMEIGSNISSVVENGNNDESFWQFKDAFSDAGTESKMAAAQVAASPNLGGGQAVNGGGPHGPINVFAASEGNFHKRQEWDIAFAFDSNPVIGDGVVTDIHIGSNDIGKDVSTSPKNGHNEADDNIWEFRNAFSEAGSKTEGNEIKSESHQESLPLSIFVDEEVGTDASSIQQDVSILRPSYTMNNDKTPGSNLSINDLIASLYGQAQQSTFLNDTPKVSENEVPSTTRVLESDLVYNDDDFDDDSWEFKDASFDTKAQNQSFATHFDDSTSKYSMKLELNDYVDFYCKLKDVSRAAAFNHFENLKKAQNSTCVSGEELKLEVLSEEIQKFHDQLRQETMISELQSANLSPGSACLDELLKVLEEPKFRVLESEYQLSDQLSLAEKDLESAIELSKHATSTLRILKLGSAEEQSTYVSTWSGIVSVCTQELKHGALIWKQALQKNIQGRLLSETQGMRCIIALGELYRVVLVLLASAKLYKPWVLLDSEESVGLFRLLNECIMLWSTSGLDEALQSISDPIDAKFDGTLKELLESMKTIHDLELQNHVFYGNQPLCRLSMLPAGIVPGMKMVVWDGGHYLLKLANLWANLITSSPPDLPHLNVS